MYKIVKIITYSGRKIVNYTKSLNAFIEAPLGISKRFTDLETYLTKLLSSTTGGCGIGKGTSDALEAYACQDEVCFVVSCVGVVADGLQIIACWALRQSTIC